jgi:hypothetical protein
MPPRLCELRASLWHSPNHTVRKEESSKNNETIASLRPEFSPGGLFVYGFLIEFGDFGFA